MSPINDTSYLRFLWRCRCVVSAFSHRLPKFDTIADGAGIRAFTSMVRAIDVYHILEGKQIIETLTSRVKRTLCALVCKTSSRAMAIFICGEKVNEMTQF